MTLFNHPFPLQLFEHQVSSYQKRLNEEMNKKYINKNAVLYLQSELDKILINKAHFYN